MGFHLVVFPPVTLYKQKNRANESFTITENHLTDYCVFALSKNAMLSKYSNISFLRDETSV